MTKLRAQKKLTSTEVHKHRSSHRTKRERTLWNRTLYEALQPPRRLDKSKHGFLVGRKKILSQALSPTLPGNRCALMHFSIGFEPPRFASAH